jgi:DinB superfamily
MVMYAQETDAALMDPVDLSECLGIVLRDAMPWLITVSEAEASVPEAEGKWSGKQVVGHLIDSAVNNLGRMVRMQIAAGQSMPGYEQRAWVDLQHYAEREWSEVLALWFALNEHLRWTVRSIDRMLLTNKGSVSGETLTLGFLIVDYIAHMEHHLRAMRLWIGTPE